MDVRTGELFAFKNEEEKRKEMDKRGEFLKAVMDEHEPEARKILDGKKHGQADMNKSTPLVMRVGLVDVDGHRFPNYALMKISAYHKQRGDSVEWWIGGFAYDRVYMSKVFTFTPDENTPIYSDDVIRGGTGYRAHDELPQEIDDMEPDYTLYPNAWVTVNKKRVPYALGFLTRGCIRSCEWCIVPQKEGHIRPYRTWEQIRRPDAKAMVLMDNNVLACDHGIEQIGRMGGRSVYVDFNQGLDARLITPEIARMLARVKWIRFVRMSCDTTAMLAVIERAAAYLKEAGIPTWRLYAYMLVRDIAEAERVIYGLDKLGITPFAQPYRDYKNTPPTDEQKGFAHWANKKSCFKSCQFKDFRYAGREALKKGE